MKKLTRQEGDLFGGYNVDMDDIHTTRIMAHAECGKHKKGKCENFQTPHLCEENNKRVHSILSSVFKKKKI